MTKQASGDIKQWGREGGGKRWRKRGECDDMARTINHPREGPFIDAKGQGKNRSGQGRSEREGTNRARKLHAIRNYFKSTTFGYVIIVVQSKARGFMHILNYIKDAVS